MAHVGPDHKWSKADIQEVHDKLCQTCDDISFGLIPARWESSIITEIEDAMDEAWCECEEGPGIFCTPEIIAWEESRDGSVLFNMPYRVIKDYDQWNDFTQLAGLRSSSGAAMVGKIVNY